MDDVLACPWPPSPASDGNFGQGGKWYGVPITLDIPMQLLGLVFPQLEELFDKTSVAKSRAHFCRSRVIFFLSITLTALVSATVVFSGPGVNAIDKVQAQESSKHARVVVAKRFEANHHPLRD